MIRSYLFLKCNRGPVLAPGEGKGTSEWKKLKESQMRGFQVQMKLGLCWAHMTLYWAYLGPIWHSTCARWAGRKELDRALKEAAEHEAVDKAEVDVHELHDP